MVGNNTSLTGGLVAAAVLFLLNYFLKKITYKNKKIRDFVFESQEILIHDGKINFEKLSHLGITNEEIKESMREHGVEHYKDVKLAMFEVDANISVISNDHTLKQTHFKRKKSHKTLSSMD